MFLTYNYIYLESTEEDRNNLKIKRFWNSERLNICGSQIKEKKQISTDQHPLGKVVVGLT